MGKTKEAKHANKSNKKIVHICGKVMDFASEKFLKYRRLWFVLSLGFLLLGWIGYWGFDNYTLTQSIRMHVGVITGYQSPFESLYTPNISFPAVHTSGKIYALIDLIFTWFFFPTLIPIVLDEVQNRQKQINKHVKEFQDKYSKHLYQNAYLIGKNLSMSEEEAKEFASEMVPHMIEEENHGHDTSFLSNFLNPDAKLEITESHNRSANEIE